MDILICLEALGYCDIGEQPAPDCATYAAMVATWRHPVKESPIEADLLAVWPALEAHHNALATIAALEALVTPRRLREAALGTVYSDGTTAQDFIQSIETQIAAERLKL